jgi:hypothetical protein
MSETIDLDAAFEDANQIFDSDQRLSMTSTDVYPENPFPVITEPSLPPVQPEVDIPEPQPAPPTHEPEPVPTPTPVDTPLNDLLASSPEPDKPKKPRTKLLRLPASTVPIKEKLKTGAAKANFAPGLGKATAELRDKKEQLSYMGRGFGASVKKLGNIEQPKDESGNPLPYAYSYKDVLGIIKEENANGQKFTNKELQNRLAGNNISGLESGNAALRLQEDLDKLRKKLKDYDDRKLYNLTSEVEKYRDLKREINEAEEDYKNQYGFVGRVALSSMGVVWGIGATAGYAGGKALLHPHTQANIKKAQKYAPYAKVGAAVLATVVLVGGVLAAKQGFSGPLELLGATGSGSGSANYDPSAHGLPTPEASETPSDAPTSPEPSESPSPSEEPSASPTPEETESASIEPEDETIDDESQDEQESTATTELDPDKTTAAESLTSYTGELNEKTGLMDGTASNSAALRVMDLGVDFDQYQDDPQFQNDLYDLTKESLISQGIDVNAGEDRNLSDDFQLELRNDLLQDFLDKYGSETAPESPDDNSNPPLSVRTSLETPEPQVEQDLSPAAANSEVIVGSTSLDQAINEIAGQISGLSPELAASFKDMLLSTPNAIAELYSGTSVSPQEAQAYSNLHNSLMVPPLEYGYEQFAANMQRLLVEFINSSNDDETSSAT